MGSVIKYSIGIDVGASNVRVGILDAQGGLVQAAGRRPQDIGQNDTNVLAMGARVVGSELAKMIADVWLEAPFEEGRHTQRINAIMKRRKMG